MSKVAVIQQASVVLDREASIAKAVQAVSEVADQGAELAVFTEAFIPGYPAWRRCVGQVLFGT